MSERNWFASVEREAARLTNCRVTDWRRKGR
jgi:hypothetical protein